MSVYIIAEAGVNHNGHVELAHQMIDTAKACGADCIKFQTFVSEKLVSSHAPKAQYQQQNTSSEESQLEMLKKLELSFADFRSLKQHCEEIGIDFLSTPFDMESLDFLDKLGVPFWKIPSGEVTNLPYLMALAKTGRDVVMSTGMCDIVDIKAAVAVLRQYGVRTICLLHCNTEYPTPFADVNLRAMDTLRKHFSMEVGYSDHTKGTEVPVAAAALGARIIEKHFTLNNDMEGPDHIASLNPQDFADMVRMIRNVEQALGRPEKYVTPSEEKNRIVARKSIVAKRRIRKGELFTEENLTVKRPGSGISPMSWFDILGQRAIRDFEQDELIVL